LFPVFDALLGERHFIPLCLQRRRDLVESLQVRRKFHMVAIEENPSRPQQLCELMIDTHQDIVAQPVQRGGAQHGVHLSDAKRLDPGRCIQVNLDPTQTPVHVTQGLPTDGEQERIQVNGDTARLRKALQQTLADRSWPTRQIKGHKLGRHDTLQHVEHSVEACLAVV
jgi:hypothetical protein